jgi:hypothetical protein
MAVVTLDSSNLNFNLKVRSAKPEQRSRWVLDRPVDQAHGAWRNNCSAGPVYIRATVADAGPFEIMMII